MSDSAKVMFKIGEFANICGVKKATLIHYAKLGILHPDHIGENGYFYYNPEQVYVFEAISLLRGMDISLDEISSFMKDQDVDTCRVILEQNLQRLRERQEYLRRVDAIVEQTIREIDASKAMVMDVVERVHLDRPIRYFAYEMPYRTSNCVNSMKNARTVIKHCHSSFINSSIAVTGIVLEKDVMNRSFQKTYGAFKAQHDAIAEPDDIFVERPAGDYLTICCATNGANITDIYRRLAEYADAHGDLLCGNGYEEDQLSHIVVHDRSCYPIRCYLQIQTQNNNQHKQQKGDNENV